MKNINLNVGGLIGALVFGAGSAAIYFVAVNPEHPAENAPAKLFILALVGGAFAGNFLWERLFR